MPKVSVVVPCYNERNTIHQLLLSLHDQTFQSTDVEVLISDGMSTDGTRLEIERFQKEFPNLNVRVVDNPLRIIPAAVNRGIEASQGEIIVRLDAHSKPYPDYLENCVRDIEADLGDNVGGVWEIQPGADTWIARSIAVAAAHPLGVGDALYRHARDASEVDTVPFGAFRRKLVERIGMFDESLLTNEDYEFNVRVRRAGGRIWLNPSIRSVYFSRSTLRELAHQYWRYGFWKWHMLKRYPDTLRWRQALPPLFVLSLISLLLFSILRSAFLFVLGIELAVYFAIMILAGIHAAARLRLFELILGLPLSIFIMHISWGSGFLWGILRSGLNRHG